MTLFAIFLGFCQIIDDILSRNCLPVIVGGTNYYIQVASLICSYCYKFPFLAADYFAEVDVIFFLFPVIGRLL